ncbi:unnamed protein product [Moneuplotes crassus]|uniref:CRAL-TRIO domain-containing protein n=1 Tax=Euplotes crassus TaxID=5936 RepID=A0AAD1XLG5_EUPCR|nr:unnamed protein product [Moneuplotes crassus]
MGNTSDRPNNSEDLSFDGSMEDGLPRRYTFTTQVKPSDALYPDQDQAGEASLVSPIYEEEPDQQEIEIVPPKKKSKRIKKVEDYFQWDSLKLKEKDMYYDFVKTAKRAWADMAYEDAQVQKTVLDKIALLRFCIARNFHPKKVLDLWTKWVNWRVMYQPHKIRKRDIKHTAFRKCLYVSRKNKLGCPCAVISPGATNEVYDIEDVQKVVAYVLEKVSKKADKNGTTQFCVIFDRTNMKNKTEKKWIPIYKEMSHAVQQYFPERLHQAYILKLNWIGRVIYHLCKPFIPKKTRQKLIILKNEERLMEYFDEPYVNPAFAEQGEDGQS